jgi:hypothetical protein
MCNPSCEIGGFVVAEPYVVAGSDKTMLIYINHDLLGCGPTVFREKLFNSGEKLLNAPRLARRGSRSRRSPLVSAQFIRDFMSLRRRPAIVRFQSV